MPFLLPFLLPQWEVAVDDVAYTLVCEQTS